MRGESFTLDQQVDPETGGFSDIGIIRVRRGLFSFRIAFSFELQEMAIAGPPVIWDLESMLTGLRAAYMEDIPR